MSTISRLYRGEMHSDLVGRRRYWYAFSGFVLLICILSMIFRGFTFSIDFKGGALFTFGANGRTVEDARSMLSSAGVNPTDSVIQELTSSKQFRVQTPTLSDAQANQVENAIVKRFGDAPEKISISTVGASWGSTITKKAIQGLVVFLILVAFYLSIRYEWKMAAAAMAALVHDLVVTAGVYSIVGFEVTPSTVIALLTILGFSLYDTVVVFDKVRENTAVIGTTARRTYAEAANDALNETLMRSINTSFVALIPVASLLFVGAGLLGAGTLEDLALAQFVGLASGAYSSIFIATPLLVDFKNREPKIQELTREVTRRRAAIARNEAKQSRASAGGAAARGGTTAVLDRDGGGVTGGPSASGPGTSGPGASGADDPGEDGSAGADQASYAATGSRPAGSSTGGTRARPANPGARRSASRGRGGRGGRPGGKRRR
ncbi:MAG: protein translocase subunit SecF [Frankia sp.]